jgi:hypothetical protein
MHDLRCFHLTFQLHMKLIKLRRETTNDPYSTEIEHSIRSVRYYKMNLSSLYITGFDNHIYLLECPLAHH